jgi:hypothetical protein
MASARTKWIDVDLDGLRKLLERRGKEFALFELVQNAWDEDITRVDIRLTRPVGGRSELVVTDDSPNGFVDLTHSYTMYGESKKKGNPTKRGAFNLGEKFVLALCDRAVITSTTGQVIFGQNGRHRKRTKRVRGTEFFGTLRLTIEEWEQISEKMKLLLPDVETVYNGTEIPRRKALTQFNATLPTVFADEEGVMRPRKRNALVRIFRPLEGEVPMLYEMGIPVVETGDTWHVVVEQKVPLNMERDNVTPAFLAAVRVAVLNAMSSEIDEKLACEPWVRTAASDSRVEPTAFRRIIETRFGKDAVSFDPSDIGSNREAASKDYTVVSGGSLSAGEWENVRRTGAMLPAGQLFSTNHGTKEPDKRYRRDEWTPAMAAYATFVEAASPSLVGHRVTVEYIDDHKMVCGQFMTHWFNVNLAHHDVSDWQANLELMLHELAHTVVKSNDHLVHDFYETVGRLGAKLSLLVAAQPHISRSLQ